MTGAVHVVVGGLLVRERRALLVHRSPHRRWYPGVWDVPGGHVEPGEEPRAALARELHEKLGVRAEVTGEALDHVDAPDLTMDVWVVHRWTGEPTNVDPAEHDAIAWVTAAEVDGLALAHPSLLGQVCEAITTYRRRPGPGILVP